MRNETGSKNTVYFLVIRVVSFGIFFLFNGLRYMLYINILNSVIFFFAHKHTLRFCLKMILRYWTPKNSWKLRTSFELLIRLFRLSTNRRNQTEKPNPNFCANDQFCKFDALHTYQKSKKLYDGKRKWNRMENGTF